MSNPITDLIEELRDKRRREHSEFWAHKKMDEAANTLTQQAAEIEAVTKWDKGGKVFDALCRVRCRNAADFSDNLTAKEGTVYDRAVLDCFKEIEGALTGGGPTAQNTVPSGKDMSDEVVGAAAKLVDLLADEVSAMPVSNAWNELRIALLPYRADLLHRLSGEG